MPRTWVANSSDSRWGIPASASVSDGALTVSRLDSARSVERGEEGGQRLELLRRQVRVRGHDARPDLEGSRDRVPRQALAYVGELGAGAVVAVLADLVAGQTA